MLRHVLAPRGLLLAVLLGSPLGAQDLVKAPRPVKGAVAVRIPNGSITLDGRPSEDAWKNIPVIRDFVMKEPTEGGVPTDSLQVRIAYDDAALFVALRIVSRNPAGIQAPVARRDNIGSAEHVWISLDTYHDHRTAYSFAVTASGVRGDWYHGSDNETNIDPEFDPVWQAAAHREPTGWTAEMRIPFSQLRFNDAPEQVWGLNFDFWAPSRNEDVFWIPVPRSETGWSSWMGTLTGISGIHPTRRLELLPYVASDAKLNADRDRANPFDDGRNIEKRVGGDLKMGVGPNLTLEATVNPDFGQVEADPAEVNLSAFETFFTEKRPFFLEGAQNITGNGANLFYSRRIGARPRGGANADYVDYPNTAAILGAAKLTGRLASGTTLGVLSAVTNRESASLFDVGNGLRRDTLVAPRAGYFVGRVGQQFGEAGSTAGVMVTAVQRDLASGEPLAGLLTKHAYSAGSDWELRFRRGEYSLGGFVAGSYVDGDSLAIGRLQRSSARYLQRPDAKSYHYDPRRTSMGGYSAYMYGSRNSGTHWLYDLTLGSESPTYEVNDIGRLGTADGLTSELNVTWRETTPGKRLRSFSSAMHGGSEWNYDGDLQYGEFRSDNTFTFPNFWQLTASAFHDVRGEDERLTRGGPLMGTGYNNVGILALSNSSAATTRWQARVYYGKDEFGAPTNRLSGLLSFKPTPQWAFSMQPNFLRYVTTQQYVTTLGGGRLPTYGNRYVFARIDQSTFIATTRLNYTFTPDVSLEVYAEPFAASGAYSKYGELAAPGARGLRLYGTDGTSTKYVGDTLVVTDNATPTAGLPATFRISPRDFNVRSFRSNVVFRWEYRPGSTLFVVWQQNRSADAPYGDLVSIGDLADPFRSRVGSRAFGAPGVSHELSNFFAVKLNFWIPAR